MAKKKVKDETQQESVQTEPKAKSVKQSAAKSEAETEVKAKSESVSKTDKTPSLAEQYTSLKEKHPDAMLLFRKGDFYETVNEDAQKASKILGITLTKPQDKSQGEQLAGFPHHALDSYLPKLVRAGVRIAIVDEIEAKVTEKVSPADLKQKEQNLTEKPVGKATEKTEKTEQGEKQHREPQMITANGGKVSHAHAYQSNKNPEDWFFTAKIDGKELHPQKMSADDVAAYSKKERTVEQLMQTYYPTKLMKQIPAEEYKAATILSDGRTIDKMNVYKEANQQSQNFGKWMLYAQVGEQKMSTPLNNHDLNAYFDRVTTPKQLVENNLGQRLHLASHYEQFKLPEGAEIKDIRVSKDADNKWRISADMGDRGITAKKELSFDDGYALFHTKTATRQQLAAKYLTPEINEKMGVKQETSLGLKL